MSWLAKLKHRLHGKDVDLLDPTDDPAVLSARYERATRLADIRDQRHKAGDLLEANLRDYRRISGPDHPDSLQAFYDLALVCDGMPRVTVFENLMRTYGQMIDEGKEVDHKRLLQVREGLACAYEMYADRLDSIGNSIGKSNLDMTPINDFGGWAYHRNARMVQETVVEACHHMYGAEHERTVDAQRKLAKLREKEK